MGYPGFADEKAGKTDKNLLYFFIAMTIFFALISLFFTYHFIIVPKNSKISTVKAIKEGAISAQVDEDRKKEFSDIDIQKLVDEEKHFRVSKDGGWYIGGHIVGFAMIDGKKCFEITNNYEIDNLTKKEVSYLPALYSYFEYYRSDRIEITDYVCVKLCKWSKDESGLFFKHKTFFVDNLGYVILIKKSFQAKYDAMEELRDAAHGD